MTQHLLFLSEGAPAVFELLMSLDERGMLWLDGNGSILYANKALAHHLGYTQSYLLNHQLFDLEEELTVLEYKKRWNALRSKGELQLSLTWKAASGKRLDIHLEGYMLEEVASGISCWRLSNREGAAYPLHAAVSFVRQQEAAAWCWDLVRGGFQAESGFSNLLPSSPPIDFADKKLNLLSALKEEMATEDFKVLVKKVKALQKEQKPFRLLFGRVPAAEETAEGPQQLMLYAEPVVKNEMVAKIRGLLLPSPGQGANFDLLAREALHRADAMICWIRPDCSLRYANRALCQRLGYTREELEGGMEVLDIDAENTQEHWRGIWDSVSEEQTIALESSLKTKEGRVFPADLYLNYLNIEGEKLISLSARDITDRRRKETDLRQALLEVKTLSEQLEAENIYLKKEVSADYNFENIITQSPKYKEVLQQVEQVAPTAATVLIQGETGTGKELMAHAIHNLSPRKNHSLVRVNCAALSESLILSELFGHEKGAFTGAAGRKIGRFELAHKGTLFLDEVGEVSLETQAKLLRVIQEGEFERLGGVETIQVDVRLIAATNRALKAMVRERSFREDLYYRLSVFPLHNPPLRERKEDIPLLVRHFLQKFAKKNGKQIEHIRARDMQRLQRYDFPGNIRELMSIVEQAVVLSSSHTLDFSYWQPAKISSITAEAADEFPTLEEVQRQHIIDALEQTRWRVTGPQGAARLLGMKGQTLFSKMKKLGVERQ